ncbi:MAG: hypothetical protein JXB62_05865 [Pirellulales bacterium]|nr:hypothetical protein [Pirellulales bacterium]
MATVPQTPHKSTPQQPEKHVISKEQLRKDRIHAAITVVLLLAAFALVAWLASLAPAPQTYDYQPWLP